MFDPDQYLASKSQPVSGGFNPDAYLASKTSTPTPSILDKAKNTVSAALSIPGVMSSPIINLPSQAQNVVNDAFGKLGEKITTNLAESGANSGPLGAPARRVKVSPNVAAAAGTFAAMTPDLVSAAAGPIEEISIAPKTAVGPARRALGYSKRFLQTPMARREATSAAATALKEGIIPGMGNPEVMMERAQGLRMKMGKGLENMRGAAGPQNIDQVLTDLSKLKEELSGGATTGTQGAKASRIAFAEETLNNLLSKGKEVSLNEVIQAKKDLGATINWLADNATQKTQKQIAKSIESSVTKILGGTGADLGQYAYLKKTYGASKSMIKALNNEISAQEGNAAASLPTAILTAGQVGTGNIAGALKTAGLVELLKRRGAGITAAALNKARIPTGATALLLNASRKNKKGQ